MSSKKLTIEDLGTFAADKGFIYGPEPEIYGGVAGFYTYGPLGKLLKNNIENAIRKTFIKHEFWEVECPTVMPSIVWKASGHLGGFTDKIISCTKCKANFRVDKLIEENFPDISLPEDQIKFLKEKDFKCPSCSKELDFIPKDHDLMMKTKLGLNTEAYNRPETATTTYLPFNRYMKFSRDKLPFGVFQIGKAYRNELSPRQNVVRGREFTQAEGQMFITKEEKNNFAIYENYKKNKIPLMPHDKKVESISLQDALKKKYVKSQAYVWTLNLAFELYLNMGVKEENIRFRQHAPTEKAFYADDAWDLEVNMKSLGWVEMAGIHDRTDYDLKQHEKFSKKKLRVNGIHPHILEIAFGSDRPCLCVIDQAYNDEKERGNIVLNFDPKIAPIKLGIFPLTNKLKDEAYKLYEELQEDFTAIYDKAGSVGRRYARSDESGIPYCLTYDFDSKEDKAVTIRDRDSTKQIRVKISKLKEVISDLINGKVEFSKIEK
jgi:glycyl-tRNA synthetase